MRVLCAGAMLRTHSPFALPYTGRANHEVLQKKRELNYNSVRRPTCIARRSKLAAAQGQKLTQLHSECRICPGLLTSEDNSNTSCQHPQTTIAYRNNINKGFRGFPTTFNTEAKILW